MRVILEVVAGPNQGHRRVLRANESLEVGRSSLADFSFEDDGKMSGQHFKVWTDRKACYLQDLGSTNGTLLDDQPVAQSVLRSGNYIVAGETRILMHIEGEVPDEVRDQSPVSTTCTTRTRDVPGSLQGTFLTEPCQSGLTLCRGEVEQVSVDRVASVIGEEYPLYLLIDFHRLRIPLPQGLGSPTYLFDWLGDDVASQMSPLFLAADEVENWPQLVEKGWGGDGLLCVFSRQDKVQLLDALRQLTRGGKHARDGGGIIGFSWPSIAGLLLRTSKSELVDDLFQVVDAVLMESTEGPNSWDLFGTGEVTGLLERLGLDRHPVEQVAENDETSTGD